MKKTIIVCVALVAVIILGIYFYQPAFFQKLHKSKTSSTTVSMTLDNFKRMCITSNGEYKDEVFFGIGPVRFIYCGYNKASDADRLCESENQINSCISCTYGASCGPAAGDFGPTHCSCNSYKTVTHLSSENY